MLGGSFFTILPRPACVDFSLQPGTVRGTNRSPIVFKCFFFNVQKNRYQKSFFVKLTHIANACTVFYQGRFFLKSRVDSLSKTGSILSQKQGRFFIKNRVNSFSKTRKRNKTSTKALLDDVISLSQSIFFIQVCLVIPVVFLLFQSFFFIPFCLVIPPFIPFDPWDLRLLKNGLVALRHDQWTDLTERNSENFLIIHPP